MLKLDFLYRLSGHIMHTEDKFVNADFISVQETPEWVTKLHFFKLIFCNNFLIKSIFSIHSSLKMSKCRLKKKYSTYSCAMLIKVKSHFQWLLYLLEIINMVFGILCMFF